ncbi:MAG: hypothetical protein E5Y06_23320 [Mesorhizobium sp.]|uniref:hypothetical protein n=1 Tax=Mesorhizobium sp. TaxID=1871066 RepID=UPI00122488A9|nr:hypothetical protein [Mesorhizobium sp.]TIN92445.1 MAG: hypothetical protein E5Y06_23320 [Mesorhizobium sp.]TJU97832.1 MAG: hypothetical protein E5Y08_15615 [Mesorhizobium sp.]
MVVGKVLLAAVASVLLGAIPCPAGATDMGLLENAMNNKPFNLAVDMSVKLASCELSPRERAQTDTIRRAALDVAAERLKVSLAKVRSLASNFAADAAQLQVTSGTAEASCAQHRAWLLAHR